MKNIVCIRVPEKDKALIEKTCKARGENVSSFVRRSVRKELANLSLLSNEEKRALGLRPVSFENSKGGQNEQPG